MIVLIVNFFFTNFNYFMLARKNYRIVTILMYIEVIAVMAAGTVSLGISYGFFLYGISLLTIFFYVNYIGVKIKTGKINEKLMVGSILLAYAVSIVYTAKYGPMYEINNATAFSFFAGNSICVFTLLIIYMKQHINTIVETEIKLSDMALKDKLTGLYNRHYMISSMEEMQKNGFENHWIAILDIDNFKKINDTYGHNCGDYVLKTVASTVHDAFPKCIVCRWGGEEFIVLASKAQVSDTELDNMRQKIADTTMEFENQNIKVTVTVGTERYSDGISADQWISRADAKLYQGKNSGKNKVVY